MVFQPVDELVIGVTGQGPLTIDNTDQLLGKAAQLDQRALRIIEHILLSMTTQVCQVGPVRSQHFEVL